MKKRFTIKEKSEGELAVRDMSDKAQEAYYSTDLISVYKYEDDDATLKAIEYAEEHDVDYFPGELNVYVYAINHCGDITLGLTFEQAEKYLEDVADSLCSDDEEGQD